ncbi:MAG: ribonuclease H-like domain-containing protein [Cellulosilyticaceae bacterium]
MSPTPGVFLDIETTGLSKERDEIVCIGIMPLDGQSPIQLIQNTDYTESDLLQETLQILAPFKTCYIWSLGNFDLDFLTARLQTYGLLPPAITCISLSKLPLFKRLKESGLTRRITIEKTIGYARSSEISGKELAKLAKLHLQTPLALYEQVILKHNLEELIGMQHFWAIYTQINQLHQSTPQLTVQTERVCLTYRLTASPVFECQIPLNTMSLHFSPSQHTLTLAISVLSLNLRKYLYPAKDYVYIASEGQLIHKSIAQFFPSDAKQKVSQSECFLTQEMSCVPLWGKTKTTSELWVDDHYNTYLPLKDIQDGGLLIPKLIKHLTQG